MVTWYNDESIWWTVSGHLLVVTGKVRYPGTLLYSYFMHSIPDLDPVDELLLLCGEKPPADVGWLGEDIFVGQFDVDPFDLGANGIGTKGWGLRPSTRNIRIDNLQKTKQQNLITSKLNTQEKYFNVGRSDDSK